MVVSQGDIWWADLDAPGGSEARWRRPVIIVQGDAFNNSRLATLLCVPLTSNLRAANAAGSVLLRSAATGLPRNSVASSYQLFALNRAQMVEHVGRLAKTSLNAIFVALDQVLGR